jgi:hypothetical protein
VGVIRWGGVTLFQSTTRTDSLGVLVYVARNHVGIDKK